MKFSKGEEEFLRKHDQCALATLLNGSPHVVPVTYLFFDNTVWIRLARGSRKHKNIVKTNRVAIVVYTHHPDRGVMIRGRAQFVTSKVELSRIDHEYHFHHKRTDNENPFIKIVPTQKASWSDRRVTRGSRVVWLHQKL